MGEVAVVAETSVAPVNDRGKVSWPVWTWSINWCMHRPRKFFPVGGADCKEVSNADVVLSLDFSGGWAWFSWAFASSCGRAGNFALHD